MEKQLTKFNVNESIKVKLTLFGKACHRKNHDDFWAQYPKAKPNEYVPPKTDAEGFSEFQLWDFMNTFGQFMFMCFELCIEGNNIYFDATDTANGKQLEYANNALRKIASLKWGNDGDCGAVQIAENALAAAD